MVGIGIDEAGQPMEAEGVATVLVGWIGLHESRLGRCGDNVADRAADDGAYGLHHVREPLHCWQPSIRSTALSEELNGRW